jgi:hypothetical protein
MSILSAFNQQLLNLSVNLSELFPDDPDIEFTKNSISLIKRTNPRKLQEIFKYYVSRYKTQILNKEAEFFLERDIINQDLNLDNSQVDYAHNIMINLKKNWSAMDSESKENVWKYLQVLVVLSDKC